MDPCAPPAVSTPLTMPPQGACDAHSHVFGPFDRFPPQQPSVYALPDASPEKHRAARAALGVDFGVIVQPGPYGDDPSALLSAVEESGGALKGIAVATESTSASALGAWAEAGICGLRFVETRAPGGQRYPGSTGFDALPVLAPLMRRAGLHAQLWGNPAQLLSWLPELLKLDLPIVLDHMAMVEADKGLGSPETRALLKLLSDERLWIKLTLCRVARNPASFENLRSIHRAMLDIAPDRALWGSDWPYVRMEPAPDAGSMFDLFCEWTEDQALRHAILVSNPRRLFGFAVEEEKSARA